MELLVFIVVSSVGLITTRNLMRIISQSEDFKHNKHALALTMAFGLGVTWLFSFLVPVAIGLNFQIEVEAFVFIITTSIMVWVMSYVIGRLLFRSNEKQHNRK